MREKGNFLEASLKIEDENRIAIRPVEIEREAGGMEEERDIGIPEGAPEPGRVGQGGDEREVKRLLDPRRPSESEVRDHCRTHLPYRNWCYHCVRGKGKDLDHRRGI